MKKQTKSKLKMYRQGDVLLVETTDTPEGPSAIPKDGRHILAYGEATGHAHTVSAALADLFEQPDRRLLVARSMCTLSHEEHAHIEIPAGTYRVTIQREYTPEAIRTVVD